MSEELNTEKRLALILDYFDKQVAEREKEDSKDRILSFFGENPLLISSITLFLCTCLGFFREYFLLRKFDVNIVTFADVDDFFLAAFKDPYVFIYLPSAILYCVILILLRPAISSAVSKISEKIDFSIGGVELPRLRKFLTSPEAVSVSVWIIISIILAVSFYGVAIFANRSINSDFRRVLCTPDKYSIVKLRSDGEILPNDEHGRMVRISATGSYVFFYGASEEPESEMDCEASHRYSGEGREEKKPELLGEIFVLPNSNIISITDISRANYQQEYKAIREKFGSLDAGLRVALDDQNIALLRETVSGVGGRVDTLFSVEYRHYTSANLKFRYGPGREFKEILTFDEGTELEILGSEGLWLRVRSELSDKEGYVHSRYVRSINAEEVPLDVNQIRSPLQ